MTPKRKLIIDAETGVNIILSHFHGDWDKLETILYNNGINPSENIEGYGEAILKLSDVKIENILAGIEY